MALPREHFVAALTQLKNNINALDQQLATVENARYQAILQESVSTLFLELNDSPTKTITLPISKFVHAINNSPIFFKLSAAGDMTIKVQRAKESGGINWSRGNDGYWYHTESRCYFLPTELAELTKSATFENDIATVTVPGYHVAPAYFFPGSEPKPAEPVVDITSATPGANVIQVVQSTNPSVPTLSTAQ